jgi:hypothetical protein
MEKLEHEIVTLRNDITAMLHEILARLAREQRCPCLRQTAGSCSSSDVTFYKTLETQTRSTEREVL